MIKITIDKELLKGSTTLLVLCLFRNETLYGYQIIKRLEQLSDGAFIFKDGTLYPILHGLEKNGCIESYWQSSAVGRKRKYYRITKYGLESLRHKLKEWDYFVDAVKKVIDGSDKLEAKQGI